jgi:hypothetical protein
MISLVIMLSWTIEIQTVVFTLTKLPWLVFSFDDPPLSPNLIYFVNPIGVFD